MTLTTLTVIGTAAYFSKRRAANRKPQTLVEILQPATSPPAPSPPATRGWGLPLRAKPATLPTSRQEKSAEPTRHHLALSAGMLGITSLGKAIFPGLGLAAVPVLLYLNLPFLAAARKEVTAGRAGIGVLDSAASLGMLALGNFFADALFLSLYFLSDRLLTQTRQALIAEDDLPAEAIPLDFQESQSERFVDAGSLPMLALGAVTWPLLGATQAVAVLVNYFGFDLRVVAPIAVLRHLQEAKRQGIQIPDGRLLEICHQDDLLFVFDATAAARPEAQAIFSTLAQQGREVVQLAQDPALAMAQTRSDPRLAERPLCFVGTELDSPLAQQAVVVISWASAPQATKKPIPVVLIEGDLTQLLDLLDLAAALNRNTQASLVITALPAMLCLVGIYFLNFGVVTAIVVNYTGLGFGVLHALAPPMAGRRAARQAEPIKEEPE